MPVSPPPVMTDAQHAALERLLAHAARDSGQGRRVANFLLAWWNAETCGAFDLTDLWAVDDTIAADMVTLFGFIANTQRYPDTLGFGAPFEALVRQWRPDLQG